MYNMLNLIERCVELSSFESQGLSVGVYLKPVCVYVMCEYTHKHIYIYIYIYIYVYIYIYMNYSARHLLNEILR
jgi:hypothetical protein